MQDPITARLDSEMPYLRIAAATTYVRDQDRTRAFYVDQLGFKLVADRPDDARGRQVAVAAPDGSTVLMLVVPEAGTPEELLIGTTKRLVLLTEDVETVYQMWLARGVPFQHPPRSLNSEATFTILEDPDGNLITLAGLDSVSKALELHRKEAAAKLDAERRVAQELVIAREVQMRLLPQSVPFVRSLDLAAICIQSRAVGGDYYDFLELGNDCILMAIGDVAGKGIAASLLMVSLQANFRGQPSHERQNLLSTLDMLNAHFCAASLPHVYATFFLAEYNGATRDLNYVNCGHLSGLILRADESVLRLEPTATVIGLFPDWRGAREVCILNAGDILILYTDGVTESPLADGEEFGEARLLISLRNHRHNRASDIVELLRKELLGYVVDEQFDDITLIIAKGC